MLNLLTLSIPMTAVREIQQFDSLFGTVLDRITGLAVASIVNSYIFQALVRKFTAENL